MALKAYVVIEDFRASFPDRTQPFRHEDALLTVWLNDAIREITNIRPDALSADTVIVALPAELTDVTITGNDLPVNDLFKEACVSWLSYRAAQTEKNGEKSVLMFNKFQSDMLR